MLSAIYHYFLIFITLPFWTHPFPIEAGVWLVFIFTIYCIEIPVFNANSVDPDQTPRSAASDLGLHIFCACNTLMAV